MRTPVRRALLALSAIACVTCGGDDSTGPGNPVPANIVISPNNPSVGQGLTLQLAAKVVDINGREIPGLDVAWTSANPGLATVNAAGVVTATGPLGTVAITADHQGITSQVDLQITQRAVAVDVTPATVILHRNAATALTVVATDFVGDPVPGSSFTFTSSEPRVASVSPLGVISARDTTGTTTITVTSGTITVQVPVTVRIVPTVIAVIPSVVVLKPGEDTSIVAEVRDSLGAPIAGASVTFTSNDPGLVSVTAAGLVTSQGPTGSGSLTAKSGTLQQAVPVFVGATLAGALTDRATIQATVYGAALHSDGTVFVGNVSGNTLYRSTVQVFDFSTVIQGPGMPLGLALSPDGGILYVGSGTADVARFDAATTQALAPLKTGAGTTFSVAVSPDGSRVFVGTDPWVYIFVNGETTPSDSFPAAAALHLAVHPGQPLVYASMFNSGTVVEFNWSTRATRTFTNSGGPSQAVAVSPDGGTLYAVSEGGPLRSWSLPSGTALPTITLTSAAFGLGVTADRIIVAESGGGRIEVFDRGTGTRIFDHQVGGVPRRVAVAPSGEWAVVANEGGWVDLIE